jgi:hypothetical protein
MVRYKKIPYNDYNIVIVDDIAEYTGVKFEEPIPRGLAKSSSHKRSY